MTAGPGGRRGGALAVALWLLALAVAVAIAIKARYVADLSAFLPSAPTPERPTM